MSAGNIRRCANVKMAQKLMKAASNMAVAIPRLVTKTGTSSLGRVCMNASFYLLNYCLNMCTLIRTIVYVCVCVL